MEPLALPVHDVDAARAALRAKVPRAYSGLLHLGFTTTLSWLVILLALSRLHQVRPLEWLTVPATLLYANLVEYLGHRGPMHHRTRGLGLVFTRHALQHHGFFTHDRMQVGSLRDFRWVLFPPVLVAFFFGLFAVPSYLLLSWLATPNVAALFVACAVAYFLLYEQLHLAYHVGEATLLGRLRIVRLLSRHHARHHEPALSTRGNFNITFPLCDWLFGTLHRET